MYKIISLSETIDDSRLKEVECICNRLNEYQKYIDEDIDSMSYNCGLCGIIYGYRIQFGVCRLVECLLYNCQILGEEARKVVTESRFLISEFELAQVIDWQETIFNRTNSNLEKIGSQLRIEKI